MVTSMIENPRIPAIWRKSGVVMAHKKRKTGYHRTMVQHSGGAMAPVFQGPAIPGPTLFPRFDCFPNMTLSLTKLIFPRSLWLAALLVSCAGPAPSIAPPSATQPATNDSPMTTPSDSSPSLRPRITVWLDSARMDGANIYRKLFPEQAGQMDFREVDRDQFPDAVLRFNQQGAGWPDVVFAETNLVAQVVDSQHDFPLDLKPALPAEVLANFEPHANDACTYDGKLLCLRHDTAPMVLYYNKPLMEKSGYQVPVTWQEYEALGRRVGREHPGYSIGSFGDAWGFKAYFDASGCPSSWVLDGKRVHINFGDARCMRAAKLVDGLLANGTLAPYGYFDPRFFQIPRDDKLLMLIAPSWMALAAFGGQPGSPYYQTAQHQLGVAAPLRWDGDAQAMTSTMGGGAWAVSKHTQDLPLALDFIVWMVSAPEFWAITPDYPVYVPVQPVWEEAVSGNPLFANDPFPVMQTASQAISPLYVLPTFDVMGTLDEFVSRALSRGQTLESLLPGLQTEMTARAEAAGYEVVLEN
jgi:ABC-type glycerol-3-phosphate transport system substrate-binding protein